MNLRTLFTRKIESIKSRLAELAHVDVGSEGSRTSRQQELDAERRSLGAELSYTNMKLAANADFGRRFVHREHEERAAEAEIVVRLESARSFADKLEREHDFRQARIWREHALSIPEQVYAERGFLH